MFSCNSKNTAILVAVIAVVCYLFQFVSIDLHLKTEIQRDIQTVVDFWNDINNDREAHPFLISLEVIEEKSFSNDGDGSMVFYQRIRATENLNYIGKYTFYVTKRLYKNINGYVLKYDNAGPMMDMHVEFYFSPSVTVEGTTIEQRVNMTVPRIFSYYTLAQLTHAQQESMKKKKEALEHV